MKKHCSAPAAGRGCRADAGLCKSRRAGDKKLPSAPRACRWAQRPNAHIFAAHGQGADSCELGAFDGETLAATGSVSRVACRPRMAHRFSVAVSVRKSYWGRGIATAMMERLIAEAKARGAEVLELAVLCTNAAAIHVYEKLGFLYRRHIPQIFPL